MRPLIGIAAAHREWQAGWHCLAASILSVARRRLADAFSQAAVPSTPTGAEPIDRAAGRWNSRNEAV
jgi:hypothetical protein